MQSHRPSTPVVLALFLTLTAVAGRAQQQGYAMFFEAANGPSILLTPGEPTILSLSGPPNAVLALAGSLSSAAFSTPLGTVGIDFLSPTFSIWIDGFDLGSAYWSIGRLDPNGQHTLLMQPFLSTTPLGTDVYSQSVATDPTSPFGYVLSNPVHARCAPEPPVIESISPAIIQNGGLVTIIGERLGGFINLYDAPIVTLDDVPLTVVSHSDDIVEVMVPTDALSGVIRLSTFGGSTNPGADALDTYVLITGSPVNELVAKSGLLTTPVTVLGTVNSGPDVDVYQVLLNAGEELFLELFPFQTSTLSIFGYTSLQYGLYLDPLVDVVLAAAGPDPLLNEDNSGPGFSAAVGHENAPRFIAPVTGTYLVRVGSTYAFTAGDYILNIHARIPAQLPSPHILRTQPNIAPPGADVSVYAWGIDLANPASHAINFVTASGTTSVQPFINAEGLLTATVPLDAQTGHVRVVNPEAQISPVDADDFASYLLIPGSLMLEDPAPTPQTIYSGTTVWGAIVGNFETDGYAIHLDQGDVVRVRAFPYDPIADRLLKGALFQPTLLDPEIVISAQSGTMYTSDAHSGPGFSAEIGGLLRPPFVAPSSATYIFSVRGWFFLSSGVYVFDIRVN